jgi:hypothetical protein
MKLPRRRFLHLAAGAATLPAVSRIARAQTYPTRPVRIIHGFAPAGGADIIARLIGQLLSERLGQSFVIENRPGAGSNIATEVVVRAPPDGYTLLMVDTAPVINTTLYDNLSFNLIRDIAPVAGIMRVPLVMVVHPSFSAKTVPEFIAYAKENPGKINMASAGGVSHVAGELFKMMTGVAMTHVPYRGVAPAATDLLGGQVQVLFVGVAFAVEYIGLVESFKRPGGNVTGVTAMNLELDGKRLCILAELVPGAARIGVLIQSPLMAINQVRIANIQAAAVALGRQIEVLPANNSREIDDPNEEWMKQMARNATMEGWGTLRDCRYLLHDRDTKYTESFRAIIKSGQVKTLKLPCAQPEFERLCGALGEIG